MTKNQIIVTILIIILLLLGVSMLNGVAKKTEKKQIMTYIVYSDETKELIENLIKEHDPDAFTDNSIIKSYEIDPQTISHNPIGGIMFMLFINNDKDLYIRIMLGYDDEDNLIIESYSLHPKLSEIWGISQYDQ